MTPAGDSALLRPLSLGEIFDRALTLYVRNIVPFTLIAAAVVLPLIVLEYFAGRGESSSFAQVLAQIQHPGKTPPTPSGEQTGWTMLAVLAGFVLHGFSAVAIGVAVGALYRGELPDWRASYAAAFARTAGILVTLLAALATFVVEVFAGGMLLGTVLVVAFLLMRSTPALGVAATIAGTLVMIAWIAGIVLCYLAYVFALYGLAVERPAVGPAIASGFSRIFNRGELLRAVLVSLALTVIYGGWGVLMVTVAVLLELAHLRLVDLAVAGVGEVVVTSLLGVLLAVYYYDVRVRREGLDLQMQIDRLQPSPAP